MDKRVVAIGVFDGVHRGHQEILNRTKEIADGGSVIALTFDPHPATVFAPIVHQNCSLLLPIELCSLRFTMQIKLL